MAQRVKVQNPDPGKAGSRIDREKYEFVRAAILDAIGSEGTVAFMDLADQVAQRLPDDFQGSVSWYTTTVKLDLEARGLIERVPNSRPQLLKLSVR